MPTPHFDSTSETLTRYVYCPLCRARYDERGLVFCRHDGARLQPVDRREAGWVGRIVDEKYRVIRPIGAGGTAQVYEAEHVHLGRRVALKLLHTQLAADPNMVQRFQQEARLVSLLAHPNVVAVEDFGALPDGTLYMAMELLHGESVADALDRGPITPAHALEIAIQACEGLAVAHEHGVVHRDVKPANLFLQRANAPGGRVGIVVKLLDLGVAKLLNQRSSNLTVTGGVFGTPEYMAPEQAMGTPVAPSADIYSLGVTLYELLLGRVPFSASSFMAVLTKHIIEAPVWPRDLADARGVPAEAEQVVLTALAKDPEQRQGSIRELQAALVEIHDRVAATPSWRLPPSSPAPSDSESRRAPSVFSRITLASARGDTGEVVEIAPDVYWVGRRHGVTLECNSYLRIFRGEGQQVALLVDPGPPKDLDVVSGKVAALIGSLERVDLIFLNHQDPDVAANAAVIQGINPRAHVVCSEDTWRLAQFYGLSPRSHSAVEDFCDQQARLATGHTLRFVPTPYCHFRGAVALYDVAARVLFSGDLFGGTSRGGRLLATEDDWPGVSLFHQIYMPSQKAIVSAVARIDRLDPLPVVIAPQHGAVLFGERTRSWLARLQQLPVGVDLWVEGDDKEKYLNVFAELIQALDRILGLEEATGILRQYSRDGSFSNLLVFDGPTSVVDFKVPPQAALRALARNLSESVAQDQLVEIYEALRDALHRQGLRSTYDASGE